MRFSAAMARISLQRFLRIGFDPKRVHAHVEGTPQRIVRAVIWPTRDNARARDAARKGDLQLHRHEGAAGQSRYRRRVGGKVQNRQRLCSRDARDADRTIAPVGMNCPSLRTPGGGMMPAIPARDMVSGSCRDATPSFPATPFRPPLKGKKPIIAHPEGAFDPVAG